MYVDVEAFELFAIALEIHKNIIKHLHLSEFHRTYSVRAGVELLCALFVFLFQSFCSSLDMSLADLLGYLIVYGWADCSV